MRSQRCGLRDAVSETRSQRRGLRDGVLRCRLSHGTGRLSLLNRYSRSSTLRTILLLLIGASVAASGCDTRTNASVARPDTLAAAKGDILLALETTVVTSRVHAGAT